MTLQQFLALTANTPEPQLRQAMTRALALEGPRTPLIYRRFYRRVVEEIRACEAAVRKLVA
jgi:hypothetical protein